MADKQYAQTIERALNDEIAALVAQQPGTEAAKRRGRTPVAPSAAAPAPQTGAPPPPAQAAPGASAPPPPPQPTPSMDDALREADEERREQASQAYGSAGTPPPEAEVAPPVPQRAAAPLPNPHTTLVNLDQRIGRLMQVRDWIQEDGDIARLIDTVIGKQVQSAERRQARLTLALNVIFLLAGWALSLVASPERLSTFFR